MVTICKVRLTFFLKSTVSLMLGNNKKRWNIFLFVLLFCTAYSNSFPKSDSTEVSISRLSVIAGVTTGAFVYGHALQNNLWWKGEKTDFYINYKRDWEYSLGADKIGHMFFAATVSELYGQLFQWARIDTVQSLWYGAGIAFAYQTYVEVRDGFSKDNGGGYLGFSPGDMAANTVGAGFPVLQHYIPLLRSFSLKISFDWNRYDRGKYGAVIDDYENTTHWLSIHPKVIIPDVWLRSWYPEWIGFSIGHSVNGLNGKGAGEHEIYLSLDWDIRAIPLKGGLWDVIKTTLSKYRLPAPAVRIVPDIVWFGLKL